MVSNTERLSKRLALMRRAGMVGGDTSNILVRRAVNGADLERAYMLVYETFLERGYIDANRFGIRIRPFEALPEMATFVAEVDRRIVGVMSIVPDSEDVGLPSDSAFGEELGELRSSGRRVAEVTNLAIAPEYRRSGVLMEMARPVHAHAVAMDYDDIFIAISPGHAGFFEDILQFDPQGSARSYAAEKTDIVEGKRWNLRTLEGRLREADAALGHDAFLHHHFYAGNACHLYVRPWATIARRAFREVEVLRRLFVERSDLLQRCTEAQREAIGRRWGDVIFRAVYEEQMADLALA